ncbi:hypothetical protein V8E51_014045, partial [Hyaloscypha variabilis]
RISIATILAIRDTIVYKGPSILFFTLNILFILLVNIGTRVKLTNKKIEKAINVVINNYSILFLNNYYILYNKPLIYILIDFSKLYSL